MARRSSDEPDAPPASTGQTAPPDVPGGARPRRLPRPVRRALLLGSVVVVAGVVALVVVRPGPLGSPSPSTSASPSPSLSADADPSAAASTSPSVSSSPSPSTGASPTASANPAPSVSTNPFDGRGLYVDPASQAMTAVEAATDPATRDAFLVLAEQPAALWLTPEAHPAGDVGPYVAQVVADAAAGGALPVFVVYGVPDRDCGQLSAGGTTVEGYEAWVREIAAALQGTRTPVILEPDSLGLAEQCGDVERRLGLVSTAGATLTEAGAAVYLDGGHSGWHSVEKTADLLRRAGVADVQGFATNVSNYNDDASEVAYAQRLRAQLDGATFVVDTGRNGNGSDGTWCNPASAALGAAPLTLEADGLDANLWVKPPGESDGTCEGGPAAGQWWPDRALTLATR